MNDKQQKNLPLIPPQKASNAQQTTRRKPSVYKEMKEGTRIDTILANSTGAHATVGYNLNWERSVDYDHVQIQAVVDVEKFKDRFKTQVKPHHIKIPRAEETPKLSSEQEEQEEEKKLVLFEAIWDSYSAEYQKAIDSEDIDEAHDIWCRAAEQFLYTYFHDDPDKKKQPKLVSSFPLVSPGDDSSAVAVAEALLRPRPGFAHRVQQQMSLMRRP